MNVISSARMAAVDENCEYMGIKRLQLMENAGAAVANSIKKRSGSGKIVIIAGKGNNGGDAFVAARHLSRYETTVVLIGKKEDIKTPEARHNWDALERTNILLIQIRDSSMLEISLFKNADILIDGLFGTGIRGKLSEPESSVIDLINRSEAFVVSIDIPSGFDPDGGEFETSVKADVTITFHKMKTGMNTPEARQYTGEIEVADIGIPDAAEFFTGPGDIQPFLKRLPQAHKGEAGKILVIGGGAYSGAPALCALGALRAGADIVTVAAPKSVSDVIASFSPNLIVCGLSGDILVEDHIPVISGLIEKHDVVVIGMGLGKSDGTLRTVREIVPLCRKMVIDADALIPDIFPAECKDTIITPHRGEMSRISGAAVPDDETEKIRFLKDFARTNRVTVLLKGQVDYISDGSEVRANRTGNAGMTVGGTGDVLAGLTGALFARSDAFPAACAAAFINGAAGDIAFSKYGYGLLATDVIDNIPEIMKP